MKIELKHIRYSETLSAETSAFTANLYVNGKKIGSVTNDGQGGSTCYYIFPEYAELGKETEVFCKEMPDTKVGDFTIKMTLEHYIDELFYMWLKEKDKVKANKKLEKDCEKALCVETKNGYELITWVGHKVSDMLKDPRGIAVLRAKILELQSKGKKILNKNIPLTILK